MLASELISELQALIEKYGDCQLLIDAPDWNKYCYDYDLADKFYVGNYYRNGKPADNFFLILNKE